MKNNTYIFYWKTGGYSKEYATSKASAEILACADRIRNGLDHEIESAFVELDDGNLMPV